MNKILIGCEGYVTPYRPDEIQTHIIVDNNKTLCGIVFLRSYWFLFNGILDDVDCDICIKKFDTESSEGEE